MVDPIGTCQALDLLTQDQLEQLFDESNGYLSKVDEIFDTVQIKEFQTDNEEASDSNLNDDGGTADTKKRRKHKHRRTSSVIVDKKCLILDVDNTLIYVRHFMDEMRVGDAVKLGDKDAMVTKLTYRLDLEFSENPGQMRSYDHVLQSKDDTIPQRGEWFPDELSKVAIIHQADPTGCVIRLVAEAHDDSKEKEEEEEEEEEEQQPAQNGHNGHTQDADTEQKKYDGREVEISFLQNSEELSQLEPMMHRENYLAVTFMYGGYLVRIRPGLGKFLALCNAKYDVILFTAADGSVYQGLLKQVHHILKTDLEERRAANQIDFHVPRKLWQQIYFRNDCDEKFDEYGLPYRHKNLAKLGRELSTIVMVDDNPLSYRGFEPNSVRVAGFWGLSQPADNELMQTLFPTLWTIADHKDVRYHLSGLGQPPPEVQSSKNVLEPVKKPEDPSSDNEDEDLLTKQRRHSRNASQKFLHHLREAIVAENESLEGTPTDDEEEDDAEVGHQHDNGDIPHAAAHHQQMNSSEKEQTSSPPMEQTPGYNSDEHDDAEDLGSVDSISSEKVDELERRGTFHEKTDAEHKATEQDDANTDVHDKDKRKNSKSNSSQSPFPEDFDDLADKVVNKYNAMPKQEESQSYESSGVDVMGADPVQNPQQSNDDNNNTNPFSDQQLDDIFDANHTSNAPTNGSNTEPQPLPRQETNLTESAIGDAGTLIFDNYDEDILYRDAYESPANRPEEILNEKRPSIELDLDAVAEAHHANEDHNARDIQSDSRPTAPNSPNIDDSSKDLLSRPSHHENSHEAETEEEEETATRGDYVLSPQQTQQRSLSTSSTKGVGTDLLNTHTDDSKERDPTNGFISIQESIEMGNTGSRPSRTPTPVRDDDAEILIEKSSGCSCFGWFGKKKKKKNTNMGLAHQDGLR